jgi:hypothetical protein
VPVFARVDCMRGGAGADWAVVSGSVGGFEGCKGTQPWRGDGCMHPSI